MTKIDYISDTVKKLVKKHGTRDPFRLCDALEIRIRYKKLGRVNGFFFYQSRIRNIVLNEDLSDISARILCAHELGHACLHKDMLVTMRAISGTVSHSGTISEYEANIFAAELLIPDEDISDLLKSRGKSLFELAGELYVPPELIDFKLRVMQSRGLCTDAPYLADADFLRGDIE